MYLPRCMSRFFVDKFWHVLKLGNFALNEVAEQFGFCLLASGAAACVVQATLEQKPVVRLVHEKLPRSFAVVESFGNVGVCDGENDESDAIPCVAGTAVVILVIRDVKRVTAYESRTAFVALRIAHREEMHGIDRHEQLEVDFLAVDFVSKLSKEALELTARRVVGDAERIAQCLENSTLFFAVSVSVGSQFVDCGDVIVGANKKARTSRAFNFCKKNNPFDASKSFLDTLARFVVNYHRKTSKRAQGAYRNFRCRF